MSANICQSKTNPSFVLQQIEQISFEDRAIPVAGPDQVIVNIKATGICGSDVHYWVHGRIGHFVCQGPMVLGHESAGVIVAVGEGVTTLKVGDRVALEPGVPCRMCEMCKSGKYNLCPDMAFAATPPYDGTLCNFYKHAADYCYKLPDQVSFEEAALIEPLSVGIHATRRGEVKLGDRVFIFGAGPVGLLTAAAAKAAGAAHVTMADISASRLEFAKSYIADQVIHLTNKKGESEDSNAFAFKEAQDILKRTGIQTCHVVFDCTGVEVCVQMSIYLVKNNGKVVLVGMGASVQSLSVADISAREVDIRGVMRYCNTYPTAVEMLASGKVDLKSLITHRYKFNDALDAFKHVREGREGTIKVVITNDDV
ncbi:chaperonin 10-like protein [Cokeromyces recurvatus]|uniref:chaperonin 10-like protein n=1 Tax=Cokeromyces recurvatus TaxID=90255 RepID=UPI00221F1200|nr:chaperonin 10-like protein [Cokeromyces recurvatus]KAI7899194.1 chaperonin 10-like protein [Cokeromyces recurvatus]